MNAMFQNDKLVHSAQFGLNLLFNQRARTSTALRRVVGGTTRRTCGRPKTAFGVQEGGLTQT
jgi:hypothetical protein